MKTLKKILFVSLVITGLFSSSIYAQEEREHRHFNRHNDEDNDEVTLPPVQFKVPNSSSIKKVVIKDLLSEIKIVGSQGNDITIDAKGLEGIPERAKGLKPLYASGCMDNTGAGVAANESGGVLTICGASKGSEDAHYVITLPKGVALNIDYNSPFANEDIEIKDMEGEIEVSTLSANVKCTNVTGPLVLNSISGNMDVTISNINQNSPTSISLISGDLDITLPVSSAVNLAINDLSGGVYTDFEMKVDSNDKNLRRIGGNNIETKLNGGGVELNLSCTSGNIYLRKK
jgi:lia operon protein LiaG